MTRSISSQEVHLYLTRPSEIREERTLADYSALLSSDEARQQQRFLQAEHRQQYLVARALVRGALSCYSAVEPRAWQFGTNPHGRPRVSAPPLPAGLEFNLSHARGLMVLSVARDREVGVDVEDCQRRTRTLEIADRFFAPREMQGLRGLSLAQAHERFYQLWTLKEAYIKARGMGLAIPLHTFSFHFAGPSSIELSVEASQSDRADRWHFWVFRPDDRHLLSLAVERRPGTPPPRLVAFEVVPLRAEQSLALHPVATSDQDERSAFSVVIGVLRLTDSEIQTLLSQDVSVLSIRSQQLAIRRPHGALPRPAQIVSGRCIPLGARREQGPACNWPEHC